MMEQEIRQMHEPELILTPTPRDIQFWREEGNKIIISKSAFIEFLESRNYRKLAESTTFQLVKIEKNSIVSPVEVHSIREEIRTYLESKGKKEVWEAFLNADYLSSKYTQSLSSIEIDFNRGTQESAVLFYQNGVVTVMSDQISITSYENCDCYVWKDQILDRYFTETDFEDAEFRQFCWNVSGQDAERLFALETLIGYLLCSYKDPATTKAVILIDENIDLEDQRSEGGTGKSLIAKAIGNIIPALTKDGKSLKIKDKFFFANVDKHHRVIVFDDVTRDFPFELLYSVITDDIEVEKKHRNPIVIEFKNAPKILITSNYVVTGTGGNSEERRKLTFEVSPYYKDNPTMSEFGHRLFDDWTIEEWQKFDCYMMHCIQQFLTHGLIEAESINEEQNRLVLDTNASFVIFIDAVLELPQSYGGTVANERLKFNKADLFRRFGREYPQIVREMTPNRFKKWLDIYSTSKNLNISYQKSNGNVYLSINKLNN